MNQREPGLYYDVPNAEYHAGLRTDPKPLSSSMAKTLVTKSPAEFQWEQSNRIEHTAFDEGQAVHELVLEGGFKTIDVYDFDSWRTKGSQAARAESYANLRHPMLEKDLAPIFAMADAVKRSPIASGLLTDGKPEASALAIDPSSGIPLQARPDWLRFDETGRPIIVDLKTTIKGANPRSFNREIAERHYHLSGAFYCRVLELLGYKDPHFIFLVVGKAAPHLVSVVRLSESDRLVGDMLVDKAITTYSECLKANAWPGFDSEVHLSALPAWSVYEAEDISGLGDLEMVV